jgi:hypothetical protein
VGASLVLQLHAARLKTKDACRECCSAETLRGGGYVAGAHVRNDWVAGAGSMGSDASNLAAPYQQRDCRDCSLVNDVER